MKVLFRNSRSRWMTEWGGDSTQLVETKRELENLGVFVDVSDTLSKSPEKFDIVHIFNIQTADRGLAFVEQSKKYGIPVVVSPIWWDLSEVIKYTSKTFPSHDLLPLRILGKINWRFLYMALKAGTFFRMRRKMRKARKMLKMADMILPNSYAELEILVQTFKAPWIRSKSIVVPNGVRISKKIVKNKEINEKLKGIPKPYVLEVATIGPLKGQHLLIKALRKHPEIPLVFVGRVSSYTYWKECQKEAVKRGNVYFLGEINHEELNLIYSNAKVHVLPSFRESPGLATLEAALHGANCVVSIYGPVAEYFGQDVWYCDPLDTESIRTAVLNAWISPRNNKLKKRILNQFTWKQAAKLTYFAYKKVLEEQR